MVVVFVRIGLLRDVLVVETLRRGRPLVHLCMGGSDFVHGVVQSLHAAAHHLGSPFLDLGLGAGRQVPCEKIQYLFPLNELGDIGYGVHPGHSTVRGGHASCFDRKEVVADSLYSLELPDGSLCRSPGFLHGHRREDGFRAILLSQCLGMGGWHRGILRA